MTFQWPPSRQDQAVPHLLKVTDSVSWAHLPAESAPGAAEVLPAGEVRAAVAQISQDLAESLVAAAGDPPRIWKIITTGVRDWASQRAREGHRLLSTAQQLQVAEAVHADRWGCGPLQPYLDDPQVEQIDVNGPDQVWVHYADQRGKVAVPPIADTDSQVTELVRRICAHAEAPRDFSDAHPLVHVSLGVGVRLAATMSVSPTTHISIRRHRLLDVSLPDLVSRDMLSPAAAEFLTAAVRARLDILVTGGQGVGKTTLLRALTAATDPDERIVTLESERELYLERIGRHRDVVALQAREPNQEGVGGVSVDDLFPTALRLHGNRIIVGEVRHTEMLSLLQACDSGAEGTLSTLHANSGREVFGRIVTLCAYSPNAPSAEDVFRLIGRAIDLVIHLRRDPSTGARYLSEVMEVLPPAETVEPATNRIFVPGPDGRAIVNPHGFAPTWISDLESAGFDPMLLDPRSGPKSTRTSGLDGMWAFNDTRG